MKLSSSLSLPDERADDDSMLTVRKAVTRMLVTLLCAVPSVPWAKDPSVVILLTSRQSTDASAWPHQLYLLCTTSGRTDTCLLVQKSVSTRLLSSQFYYKQQKPGLLLPPTSKLWKPSRWSVRDSCCRSAGNSLLEMTWSQRLPLAVDIGNNPPPS